MNMADKKIIYIADDEKDIREAMVAFLINAGYKVFGFETGDLLLEAFDDLPADLVVLDVMMPGSNGFACCKEIRAKSYVPIFMLTARDSDLDYQTGLDLGCDDFFTKPISLMTFVMRVNALFKRIEYEREYAIKQFEGKG
jgi:DNA-binding response OmpR family regulator